MYRDFTYVDNLVNGIKLLVDCVPNNKKFQKMIVCLQLHRSELLTLEILRK